MSRVQLVQKDKAPPKVKAIYDKVEKRGAMIFNLYKVLAHSPGILRNFMRMGNALLTETELSPKLRELAILRVATLAGSEYEWAQHYRIALGAGVSQEQAEALSHWRDSKIFSDEECAVLQYTDEVAQNIAVHNETFKALQEHLNERGIVELTASIGYWGMAARLLVPLQIEIDTQLIGSVQDLAGHNR